MMPNSNTGFRSHLPSSTGNFRVNCLVFTFFFVVTGCLFHILPQEDRVFLVTISLVLTVGLLWIHDLCYVNVQRRNSTGLMPPGAIDKGRIVIKLIGLYGTFFIILLLYGLNPFYRETTRTIQFYGYFFSFLKLTAPAIIILSFAYFCFIDRRQKDPYDSYWHMGCVLTGRWRQVKGIFLREHGRVWFIKAFFIPFMFGLLMEYLNAIFSFNWSTGLTFALIYEHSLNIFYTFDVLFGVLGYLLTLRLTDNHVQSTEPTILGWVVCLACYHPFYSLFGIGLLQYQSSFTWEQWLSFNPVLFYGVGLTIMALSAVYGLATVAFGYRMSNLTYRGIITDGPYRFTKHPAYLAKVLSWWLISLPFLSLAGPLVAAKQTLALIVISFIYYFRAKTEENHLANYPEYVQYANWIDQHGIFHTLKKYFPGLRFSQENSRRWNSVVWFKKLG